MGRERRLGRVYGVMVVVSHDKHVTGFGDLLTFSAREKTWLHSGEEFHYSPRFALLLYSVSVERQGSAAPGEFSSRIISYNFGLLDAFIAFGCRRYTQSVQTGLKPEDESQKELEPLKLPGRLAEYTGNVMYPNEDSAVWDVNGILSTEGERGREKER